MRITRSTARVLPVDPGGRVLLLRGRGLVRRGQPYWMSVGGGRKRGESLAQAAVRELHEEAGISAAPAALGRDIGTTVISYPSFRMLLVTQYQTYFVLPVTDTAVTFAHQGALERRAIEAHAWLTADEFEGQPERGSDPALPRMMRAAAAAAAGNPAARDLS